MATLGDYDNVPRGTSWSNRMQSHCATCRFYSGKVFSMGDNGSGKCFIKQPFHTYYVSGLMVCPRYSKEPKEKK